MFQIYIQVKGYHQKTSTDVNLVPSDMYLKRFLVDPQRPQNDTKMTKKAKFFNFYPFYAIFVAFFIDLMT